MTESSEENYLRLEEQDLRILKNVISNPLIGIEFANTYDESLFLGDARPFAKSALSYIKAYKAPPTKRVMLEHVEDKERKEQVSIIWDSVMAMDSQASEFKYDLDKIKNRFGQQKVESIKEYLSNSSNQDDLIAYLSKQVQDIKRIRLGQKQAYMQKTLKMYMPEFKQLYHSKVLNKDIGRGILTGYSFFDYVKNGMQPAELLIIGGESGAGKLLPLTTLLPTPSGFKKMEDIHPGDLIFGRDGKQYTVLAESKVVTEPGWKFIFNDGTEIVSHDRHLWLTFDRNERQQLHKRSDEFREKRRKQRAKLQEEKIKQLEKEGKLNKKYDNKPPPPNPCLSPPTGTIRTTAEIVETLKVGKNKNIINHCIPIAEPLELLNKNLILDPYILGVWLGDGTAKEGLITSMDSEIIKYIEKRGYECIKKIFRNHDNGAPNLGVMYRFKGLTTQLRTIGVLKGKYIPHDYLWASKEQRLALLQGLMDTDGYANKKGNLEFCNTNKRIIDGMVFLINSLGEKCSVREKDAKLYGRITSKCWVISFTPSFPAFRLSRKLERQNLSPVRLNKFRLIKEAIKVDAVPMKCIQVSSPDNLYLAGEQLVPTHNSMLLNNMAIQMWLQKNQVESTNFTKGYNVLYFSLEMPYEGCARRTLARLADVSTYALRDASLKKFELEALSKVTDFIDRYPYEFEIVDIPRGVTPEQIELRFQEACSRYHPDIVVVDYLGLLEDPDADGDDWLKLGHIAGKLHEIARVHNIAMLTAVQLNRVNNKGKEASNIIGMHRIGRSSLIMHHANVAIQIESRPDEHTYADMRYHVIKNRDGELGMHVLMKNFAHATIKDMDPPFVPQKYDLGSNLIIDDDISGLLAKYNWGKVS